MHTKFSHCTLEIQQRYRKRRKHLHSRSSQSVQNLQSEVSEKTLVWYSSKKDSVLCFLFSKRTCNRKKNTWRVPLSLRQTLAYRENGRILKLMTSRWKKRWHLKIREMKIWRGFAKIPRRSYWQSGDYQPKQKVQ